MVFFVFVAIFVVAIWTEISRDNFASFLVSFLSGAAVIVSLVIILCNYVTVFGFVNQNTERYEALMYKIEALNNGMGDEFGIRNTDVVSEVQSWNEDLTWGKVMQRDFWVGIYIPNVYDDFEKIPYENFEFPIDN